MELYHSKKQLNKQVWTVRLARWSAHHCWPVFGLWFAFTLGLFAVSLVIGTNTNELGSANGPTRIEAARGSAVFNAEGSTSTTDTLVVVVTHPTLKATDLAFKDEVNKILEKLRSLTYTENITTGPTFTSLQDPYSGLNGLSLISTDGSTVRLPATFPTTGDTKRRLELARPALQDIKQINADFKVYAYNGTLLNSDFNKILSHDLDDSLKITLPLTFLILLIAFGAVAAACIPLILAVTSLVASFGVLSI